MSWRGYLILSSLSLGILLGVAAFQRAPGYMDAEYYFAGGMRLARGEGFSEPFLWNYLDNPAGLPHPSHAYWMPLASILAFLPMKLGNSLAYSTGRLGFILIAACVPALTAVLAYGFTRSKWAAWLAGILALFPAFYLAYLPASDTFGLYMLLGGLWLVAAGKSVRIYLQPAINLTPFLLGLISGLMHLTRADGVLWLGISLLACLWLDDANVKDRAFTSVKRISACLLGYLLVMGTWLVRNQILFGAPLSPGGGKALWFVGYNDLYAYPASLLTYPRWLSSGAGAIFSARLESLGQNLLSALVVQGEIFLAPLILLGLWRLRHYRTVHLGVLAWALTLGIMSLIFPYAGARGGFFHSAAAVQTLLWASVPAGLQVFIEWGSRWRGWRAEQAFRFFQIGLVLLAVFLSTIVVNRRVVGSNWATPVWNEAHVRYTELGNAMEADGLQHGEIVMVNNPPGYYLATGEPSIAIPDGDIITMLAAARRYSARYVLLEPNHPPKLNQLYASPVDHPGLLFLGSIGDTHLFEILQEPITNGV